MKKILVVAAHSHTWFWSQNFITSLKRFDMAVPDHEVQIVLVDNSWPWSPTIKGVASTALVKGVTIFNNPKPNKFHPSALDATLDKLDFDSDYIMAMETDVQILRNGWLHEFIRRIQPTDYAVGAWHHEQFINPSCTLYRTSVAREMQKWCKAKPSLLARWGDNFNDESDIGLTKEQ